MEHGSPDPPPAQEGGVGIWCTCPASGWLYTGFCTWSSDGGVKDSGSRYRAWVPITLSLCEVPANVSDSPR